MTAAAINRLVAAAHARLDDLEAKLAAAIEPLLVRAGVEAARAFEARVRAVSLTAAGPDVTDRSTMVALKPTVEQAAALAVAGGFDADTLHITLAYLGETDGPLDAVAAVLAPVARHHAPLSGIVGGIGRFDDYGEGTPVILLPDVPGLSELRVAVTTALCDRTIGYSRDHGFLPHLTLLYSADAEVPATDALGAPLTFAELLIVRGDTEVLPLPLSGPPPLTASGGLVAAAEPPPAWASPYPDEILDVDALVAAIKAKTDPVRNAVIESMGAGTARLYGPEHGGDYSRPPGLAVRLASQVRTGEDLRAFARMPDATDGVYDYFTHAVRHNYEIDVILEHGLRPDSSGIVFGSRPPLVRDRGAGYVVFRVPVGSARETVDFVEEGLTYPEFRVGKIAAADVVKAVRVMTGRSGFRIREDELAENLLTGQVPDEDLADLPETHQWAALPSGTSMPNFSVTNPFVAEVMVQSASQVTAIADTTRLNVMRTIRAAYDAGLSIPHTAKAIRAGMAEASPARARLIARTEMVGAVNGGSVASVKVVAAHTGVRYLKRWMTAPGAKTPRHHIYDGLNGQTRPLSGEFDVGGYPLAYPGDPNGPPGEVCNCRCAVAYDEPA